MKKVGNWHDKGRIARAEAGKARRYAKRGFKYSPKRQQTRGEEQ